MVLGLRSKTRKGSSVKVDYLIHVREIKPWPPSQSLASAQCLLLQWENGDKSSGSLICNAGDGKVEFSEFFRLTVTLSRDASKKSNGGDTFHKNYLEFNLYEPRKDKTMKGQLLGSAAVNLAECGIIKDLITVSAPINFKKSSKSMAHSVLYINVQPFDRNNSSLAKEVSIEKDGSESVSEITNDEESEIASFTDGDDDVSSNSSRNIPSFALESSIGSSSQYEKNGSKPAMSGSGMVTEEPTVPLDTAPSNPARSSAPEAVKHQNGISNPVTSTNLSSNVHNPINDLAGKVVLADNGTQVGETSSNGIQGATANALMQDKEKHLQKENGKNGELLEVEKLAVEEKLVGRLPQDAVTAQVKLRSNSQAFNRTGTSVQGSTRRDKLKHLKSVQLQFNSSENDESFSGNRFMDKAKKIDITENVEKGSMGYSMIERKPKIDSFSDNKIKSKSEVEILEEEFSEAANANVGLYSTVTKYKKSTNEVQVMEKEKEIEETIGKGGEDNPPIQSEGSKTNGSGNYVELKSKVEAASANVDPYSSVAKHKNSINKVQEMGKEKEIVGKVGKDGVNYPTVKREETKFNGPGNKVELKSKVEMLEEELMEAAAVEIGLYSVVAEHGSSTNKVHAPARRLSRFYLHTCKERSEAQRAAAARAIISGLVLVSKACGNDVPRLSFWMSNTIMLRTIVSEAINSESLPHQEKRASKGEDYDEWEEPQTYMVALQKVEAWIFSRIIESVWWQTLTPHMQSTAVKGSNTRKTHTRRYGLGDQEQGNFAIDLWKKAFKDACERLCPIRAGGHECGCLPVLSRLVMEQLVCRLDVAMFNAILRESAEEMPTDPVSDPISDPKVLPIPAGKSSFGAGAQLKNAVGSWSRWLTDLFGIDDTDPPEDKDESDSSRLESDATFKVFHLLNALSDLMMLPFDMLADRSTRKEVCPTFDAPLIKRVLNNFVPDEFNPDPIPLCIFEALDSEDLAEGGEDCVTNFPFVAAPAIYTPPSVASLMKIIGEVGGQALQRTGSTLLRKSYTSDDELDELDSPMTSIITDSSRTSPLTIWMPKGKGGRKVVRYQLLREVWKNDE